MNEYNFALLGVAFRLFNMYILWLEEESFHKGDIYIPSLPKHYDAHRLAKIMQNQQVKKGGPGGSRVVDGGLTV